MSSRRFPPPATRPKDFVCYARNMGGSGQAPTLERLAATYRESQLATLVEEPPRGAGWSYETKYDGYRILALKVGRNVRLVSRRGQDWTEDFQTIADAVAELPGRDAVLDGEVCAIDERGLPSFQALQNRGSIRPRLVYFAFDALEREGEDLRGLPLGERRTHLAAALGTLAPGGRLVLSSAVAGDPRAILKAACEGGLEGIVAKRTDAPYTSGRSKTWLKVKCFLRQEFAIVGWVPLLKTRPVVGSLVLALVHADGQFHYAGNAGTGFDEATRKSLFELLSKEASSTATALDVPRLNGVVRFTKPRHVAEVRFAEWTKGGHVRHPSFQGLRRDKRPEDCVREAPVRRTRQSASRGTVR